MHKNPINLIITNDVYNAEMINSNETIEVAVDYSYLKQFLRCTKLWIYNLFIQAFQYKQIES